MAQTLKTAASSFYSGQCYGELAFRRTGIGMKLVLLLSFVILAFFFLSLALGGQYAQLHDAIEKLPAMADTLPAISVKDGKLSIDKPVPYTLTLGSAPDDAHIVVDTNYKVTRLEALEAYMRQNRIILLATADKLVSRDVRKDQGQPMQIDDSLHISDIKDNNFAVTHDNWRALGETVKAWGMPAITAVILLGMFFALFLGNFLSTVFSAVAIMIVDLGMQLNLEFPAAMRLAAAFRIPVTVLSMLPVLVGMRPIMGFSNWVLWGLYLVFAVWSVRLYRRV